MELSAVQPTTAMVPSVTSRLDESEAAEVGAKWEAVRRRLGWSLEMAAKEIGITPNRLNELEAGFRELTPAMAADLGKTYGVEPERLERRAWADRIPPRYDAETNTLWMGWLPIELNNTGNEALLVALADAIRSMRFIGEADPVIIRETEFEVLLPLFDLSDDQLAERLERIFALDKAGVVRVLRGFVEVLEATKDSAPH